MIKIRDNEQDYARLNDPTCAETNRYGQAIQLTPGLGTSLNINGDSAIGDNPNRNKQHGFHFTADNCIGCHACEAACSEKNDLPAHIAFRSVGYVESGIWPNYSRTNISMACNHCDDPVCLKGCPTNAYTKHPEYGAVIQDPDICFGCGYCTWVCPYNAPQLDPVAGHVQKCNMCVDRLEVGLQPACVSACLGNALSFGVIENTPEGRDQTKTEIPGFPDPSITRPNIRFQQTENIAKDYTRPDSDPLDYLSDSAWNLKKLYSRENPLVIFTLITQAVTGAFTVLFLGQQFGLIPFAPSWSALVFLIALMSMQGFALFLSTLHLGKPWRFYRGFNNLRHSPLSREALGVALFFGFLGSYTLLRFIQKMDLFLIDEKVFQLVGGLAVISGILGLYFMTQIYRIKARPFWDHWHVSATFFGTALSLGGVVAGLGTLTQMNFIPTALAFTIVLGLAWERVGLFFHARDLMKGGGEGEASHHNQVTKFKKTYVLRNALLVLNIFGALLISLFDPTMILWLGLTVTVLGTATIGRALFYVLVIPTTMPGAFFWKNKAFEEHARETGLADMPQCGVVAKGH